MTKAKTKSKTQEALPLIPLRNMVVFPQMIMPLFIGRPKSVKALEESLTGNRTVILASQKDEEVDEPKPKDICEIATLAEVIQMLKLPDGTTKVLVEGITRARIEKFVKSEPYFTVTAKIISEEKEVDVETEALVRLVIGQFENYIKLNKRLPADTLTTLTSVENPGRLADLIASYLTLKLDEKQKILETIDIKKRMEMLSKLVTKEIEVLEVEKKLHGRVREQVEKLQKEYYLREKLKAIHEELGVAEETSPEVDEYKKKIEAAKMPEEAKKQAIRELGRLSKTPNVSAEAGVIRTYLDLLVELPWEKKSRAKLDVKEVSRILEEDHYGLEKVKERILEYFSVYQLTKKMHGSILCFVGPAGVGKTSISRSIARAMKRKFVRLSLGGVRDEAEIRGHRRTYVGALPGRIIQSIRKVDVRNPVFLLDEVDKMAADFRGDPAAALMEILDPEQNVGFSDHYLEVPFNLSDVMFICTANASHLIPRPLLDRMEVIELPGYTEEEKVEIAKNYLISKQLEKHGLEKSDVEITDEALRAIIREHTREAGVRNLERSIASIYRKVARFRIQKEKFNNKVSRHNLRQFLGIPKYHFGTMQEENQIGVTTGLVWTEAGGDIIPVEVVVLKGKGQLTITGQLGEVMQESAQAALSYIRSRSGELGLEANFYRHIDLHIHVPEGAIPKDGPSAGITIATAIASALTETPVRKDVAMTGEVTLRGRVLAIGGLKEKTLAAHRAGIKTLIIPFENEKDLEEIPKKILKKIKFYKVKHMDEVLARALCEYPVKKKVKINFGEKKTPEIPLEKSTPASNPTTFA